MSRGVLFSAALHVAVFLVFLLGPGPKPFEWDRADAVPVDLVSPPVETPTPPAPEPEPVIPEPEPAPPQEEPAKQETPPEEKPPEPEPVRAPKPKPKPPERIFRKYAPPREDPEPSLAERLRQRLAEESEVPAAAQEAEESVPEPPPAPAATAAVEAVNFPYEWYLNILRTKIFAAWDPPGERLLAGHRRQVVVRFRIHRDGSITDVRVDDASGTPGLDTSAQRAIERGGPYPPLPDTYEDDWLDLGVRFTVTEGGA